MDRNITRITSTSNPGIRQAVLLQKKRKEREESGLFPCEGIRLFGEIPPEQIERIYVSDSFLEREDAEEILKHAPDKEVFAVKDSIFVSLCDTSNPQGILAIVRRKDASLEEILELSKTPFFMMVENLQDPGNLGTILRSGEGAGITALIMSKGTVDIYSPKVIRSTMGALFRVPFIYVEDIAATVLDLRKKGIKVYAAHLEGSVPYDQASYQEACAILVGNEGNGLTDETTAVCTDRVRIPMEGQLESLNAAVSAAIFMYEAHRQRNNA